MGAVKNIMADPSSKKQWYYQKGKEETMRVEMSKLEWQKSASVRPSRKGTRNWTQQKENEVWSPWPHAFVRKLWAGNV